jgi:RNA polymerase subunit RPABC4/transcription elongation factor Spt4
MKEFDKGHPARWNMNSTVNRPERKRKHTCVSPPRLLSPVRLYRSTISTILIQEATMDNQSGTAANRFCGGCGAPLPPDTRFCPSCGKPVDPSATQAVPAAPTPPQQFPAQPPQQFPAQAAAVAAMNPQGLKCPRCGSPQVQTTKRGWKWTTGMIGSGNTVSTCLQCGNKF